MHTISIQDVYHMYTICIQYHCTDIIHTLYLHYTYIILTFTYIILTLYLHYTNYI